jgi:uncharacterized protein YdeI (YjbR/CyaY-like superfamily)
MTVAIGKTFYPKDRASWRAWLTNNHADKKEIWVVYYKKATGKPTILYQDAVDEALCVGWIDGMEKRIDDERYAQRFSPRAIKSSWSTINVGRYKRLVSQGLMKEAGTQAFLRKTHSTISHMKKGGWEWHKLNKMPKSPSRNERLHWHREHQTFCGCRPVPKSLQSLK